MELWLHQPDEAALRARLTPPEAREQREGQAADIEDATPSFTRSPACERRVVVAPDDELFCEDCKGDGRITIPGA